MNRILLLPLFALSFSLTACNKDDDHNHDEDYEVTINIVKPTDGFAVGVNQDMEIEVVLDREDDAIIHNLKIEAEEIATGIDYTIYDEHVHDAGPFTLTGTFSVDTPGAYKLIVTTTNDEGEQPNVAERNFIVM